MWARGDSAGGQVSWKAGWMLAMVEAAVAVVERREMVVRKRWWRIVGFIFFCLFGIRFLGFLLS